MPSAAVWSIPSCVGYCGSFLNKLPLPNKSYGSLRHQQRFTRRHNACPWRPARPPARNRSPRPSLQRRRRSWRRCAVARCRSRRSAACRTAASRPAAPLERLPSRAHPSACTSATVEPSHVLRGMGVEDRLAHSSLRITLGRFTTEEEADFAADKLLETLRRLRGTTPAATGQGA